MGAQVNCKYIVLGARTVLRSIAQRCVLCRKRDSIVISPLMADLPKERLGYMQPPFANCGVDYFGRFFACVMDGDFWASRIPVARDLLGSREACWLEACRS